jgi:hypothetical protein
MTKVQLSKGFLLQFHQIARLLRHITQNKQKRFAQAILSEALGLSVGMVEQLASLAVAIGLIKRITYAPTELGCVIAEYDAYLDDVGTLWLCHYNLASNPFNLIWNRMVNQVLPNEPMVTLTLAKGYFSDVLATLSPKNGNKQIRNEITVFFNAYTEQQFNRLHYLTEEDGKFRINQPVPVPDLIVAAAVVIFRDRISPQATAVDIPTLCAAENSIGRVFVLPETTVRETLERLHRRSVLTLESRADLDQVRLPTSSFFLCTLGRK